MRRSITISVKSHSWKEHFRFFTVGVILAFGDLALYGSGSAMITAHYLGALPGSSQGLLFVGALMLGSGILISIVSGYEKEKQYKERSNIFLEVINEHIEEAEGAESGVYQWKRDLLKLIRKKGVERSVAHFEGDKDAE